MLSLVSYSTPVLVAFGGVVVAFGAALVALGYWAHHDAAARDSSIPLLWGVVSTLPYGVLYYLWVRRGLGDRERPRGRRENAALTWALAVVLGFVFAAVVAPPDPATQVVYFTPAVAVALPVAYALVFLGGWGRIQSWTGA